MTAVRHPGRSAPRPQRPAQLFGEAISEWPQHGGSRGVQETVAREVACQRVELRLVHGPAAGLDRLLPAEPAQFGSVENGDPRASQRDEALVCKLPENLGRGLPGGGCQGGELFVGQFDLYSAAKRPARPGCGECNECAGYPLGHGLKDGVSIWVRRVDQRWFSRGSTPTISRIGRFAGSVPGRSANPTPSVSRRCCSSAVL